MNGSSRRFALLAVIATLALPMAAQLTAKDSVPAPTPLDSISEAELRGHVEELASDSYQGRDTLQPGCAKARKYLVRQFEGYGLAPLPEQSSFELPYDLNVIGFDPDRTKLAIEGAGLDALQPGRDFAPFGFSGTGEVEGEVVFVGYGVRAPKKGFDDYSGLDVRGKIVFLLRHTPNEKDPDHPLTGSVHASFMTKVEKARERGALAMLLVTDPLHHEANDDLRLQEQLFLEEPRGGLARLRQGGGFLSIHVSRAVAEAMAQTSGSSLEDLQRAVDSGRPSSSLKLSGVRAKVSVRSREVAAKETSYNVAGCIPGSDERLKDEWVVVGAHYDHVGGYEGSGDTVFNGADDNASGTAGLLELAEAFAQRGPAARSIAFIAFSGEEKGLLGSRAFVDQGILPLDKIKLMYNIDMIGRNPERAIEVGGDGFSEGLEELVRRENASYRLDLAFQGTNYQGNSDHDSFFRQGVPFLFLHTGLHRDYHQLGDHADKVEFGRMETISRLSYRVLDSIASGEVTPRFVHHIAWLGAKLKELDEVSGHALVTDVDPDARGAKAGLTAGDVIVSAGERGTETVSVGGRLSRIQPGSRVMLQVLRDGDLVEMVVERARVGFIGIFPGPVDEDVRKELGLPDNEGVLIGRVVPQGPALAAGVKAGDILIRISGYPVAVPTLRSRLMQIGAGETVELTLLRDGERITLPITLAQRPGR